MQTKECFKCKEIKDIGEFYTHPKMKDGVIGKCKACTRKDSKAHYYNKISDPAWAEAERARNREKAHRLGKGWKKRSKEALRCYHLKWVLRFPEKKKATSAAARIIVPDGLHKHHWSYLPEHRKDIITLTLTDHKTVHRYMIYDHERMMYRTRNGVLLDSKESAIAYYKTVIT